MLRMFCIFATDSYMDSIPVTKPFFETFHALEITRGALKYMALNFKMQSRISMRGCVRPSVGP